MLDTESTDYQALSGRRSSRRREDKDNVRVAALLEILRKNADERVNLRSLVEDRWIRDLRQYHGEYDQPIKNALHGARGTEKPERSTVFMNLTRPKTNALSARLMDLMFPTDDRSWGIQPTPVPEMDQEQGALEDRKQNILQTGEIDPEADPDGAVVQQEQLSEIESALADLHELSEEAQRRSDLMQAEIDDQFKASKYQAHCRDAVEDACKLGTGVLKGPVFTEKSNMKWVEGEDGFGMVNQKDDRPGFVRVDPWGFFPDPHARTVEECEGFFERHLMTKKDLRRLSMREDMDKEAIRNLLRQDPEDPAPQGMSELFSITNDEAHQVKGKYQVWEYTGPIEPEDMQTLIDVYEDQELAQDMQEIDPLTEISVKVWFCQNELLAFALHPLESNESIYSVYNVERSETGLFGFGVPYIIRDPQSVLNASWRLMMDNARVSAGPQVVINRDRIKSEDNHSSQLEPFKIWNARTGDTNDPPFQVFHIQQNQGELQNIIVMSREMLDEMSSMPQIAQGEQGAGVTRTAQGMALLMNSANVVFRRMVKNWDDDMTVPNVRRMYDYNMQYSPKSQIKGDYEIDARGSSVLLVREIQSTNLMNIASTFADHPEYKYYIDKPSLLQQVFRANMLPTTGIVKSEREAAKDRAKDAASQETDPMVQAKMEEIAFKREELDAKVAIAEMDRDARIQVAKYNYDAAMEKAAANLNDRDEERALKAELADHSANDRATAAKIKADSDDRKLATEVAMRERTGDSAGGSV